MAPLTEAVRTTFFEEQGGTRVYRGDVDKEWAYIFVPHGGYALGLIVDACVSSQAACRQQQGDIAHLSAHFYRTTAMGQAEIRVRTMRRGAVYTNIVAELVQKDEVKIIAQLIFKGPSVEDAGSRLSLLVPSAYARRIPLQMHPSMGQLTPPPPYAEFKARMQWAEDPLFAARNRAVGRSPGNDGGGVEWGAWVELVDPVEEIGVALLPFMGDMMKGIPDLLPQEERPAPGWNPTMTFALEYKAKIPEGAGYARRTVGLYACGRFMHGGQHDAYVEIWTAPAGIGEGVEEEGWREKQVCLGIAQQMALWVPAAVVERRLAAREKGKL